MREKKNVMDEFYTCVQQIAPMCRANEGFKVLLVTPWWDTVPSAIEFGGESRIVVGSYRKEEDVVCFLGLEYDWIGMCGPRLSEETEQMLLTCVRSAIALEQEELEAREALLNDRKAGCVASWPQTTMVGPTPCPWCKGTGVSRTRDEQIEAMVATGHFSRESAERTINAADEILADIEAVMAETSVAERESGGRPHA